MSQLRPKLLFLVLLGLIFSACGLIAPEQPLPTREATAVPLAQNDITPIRTLPPTSTPRAIPTASPTSQPTPAQTAVETAEPELARSTQTSGRDFATSGTDGAQLLTATPADTAVIPTPTITPSPTPFPTLASTPTSTPVLLPILPDEIWPAMAAPGGPVATSPRHGVAAALGGGAVGAYGSPEYSWTYSWSAFVPKEEKAVQHIPMLVGSPNGNLPEFDVVVERDGYNSHNYWLVFNECEHQGQCNTSPEEAARFFHDRVLDLLYVQGADADAELIVGGVNAHPCGIAWLENFVNHYRANYGDLPVAGWHFHIYPEVHPSGWPNSCNGGWSFNDTLFPNPQAAFDLWRDHAYNALEFVQTYGRPDDEIWFTEIGCLNNGFHQIQAPVCQADGFVQEYSSLILGWLNGEGRWVTRYAWYTNWDATYWITTHLIADAPPGERWTYTSLGYWYSQIIPASAIPRP